MTNNTSNLEKNAMCREMQVAMMQFEKIGRATYSSGLSDIFIEKDTFELDLNFKRQ